MDSHSRLASALQAAAEEAQKEKDEIYTEIMNLRACVYEEIDNIKNLHREKVKRIIAILQEDDF